MKGFIRVSRRGADTGGDPSRPPPLPDRGTVGTLRGMAGHFVVTRFEVDLGRKFRDDHLGPPPGSDERLRARFELFRDVCVPSMQRQTVQDFTWLLFCDESRRSTIDPFLTTFPPGTFEVVYLDEIFTHHVVARHLEERAIERPLITTRLDCDDALPPDHVESVQAAVRSRPGRTEFLTFPVGFQHAQNCGAWYLTYTANNGFVSFVEQGGTLDTVYCVGHEMVASRAPLRVVSWKPGWVVLAHGANLSSRADGIRIGPGWPLRRVGELPGFTTDTDTWAQRAADRASSLATIARRLAVSRGNAGAAPRAPAWPDAARPRPVPLGHPALRGVRASRPGGAVLAMLAGVAACSGDSAGGASSTTSVTMSTPVPATTERAFASPPPIDLTEL